MSGPLADMAKRAARRVSQTYRTDLTETEQECWAWMLDNDKKTGEPRMEKLERWVLEGKFNQALLAIVEGVGRNGYGRRELAEREQVDYRDLDRRKERRPHEPEEYIGQTLKPDKYLAKYIIKQDYNPDK